MTPKERLAKLKKRLLSGRVSVEEKSAIRTIVRFLRSND